MVDMEGIDPRPAERDGDVDMIGDNEQEVEEPPPRLMITKMVRCMIYSLRTIRTTFCFVLFCFKCDALPGMAVQAAVNGQFDSFLFLFLRAPFSITCFHH